MRIYKQLIFNVGTKLPFFLYPCVVEKYLDNLGLEYSSFLYYFEELDFTDEYSRVLENYDSSTDPGGFKYNEANDYLNKIHGCRKAHFEHPEFGGLRHFSSNGFKVFYLSNLDRPSKEARNVVFPLMSKIYRKYGFSKTVIAYHGVDFFGSGFPSSIYHENGIYKKLTGQRIVLERTAAFPKDSTITIHFDITNDPDAAAIGRYRDTMLGLLPEKIRVDEETYCVLTDEETEVYDELTITAKPAIGSAAEAIRKYIADRVSFVDGIPGDDPVSLASPLKKAAKTFGYVYWKPYYHFYNVIKRTPNSHVLKIEIESGHYGNEMNVYMDLIGAGFSVRVAGFSFAPADSDDVKIAVNSFFEAIDTVDNGDLKEIDALFPPSPENYLRSVIH